MLSHFKQPLFLIISILLATPLSWAEDAVIEEDGEEEQHPIVAWTETCLNKEEGNVDMQACFSEAYKRWDKELDEVYQELLKQLDKKEQTRFKKAQTAWLQYREVEFELIDAVYGDSEDISHTPPLMPLLSKIAIVKSRVAQFDSYIEVLSGELQDLVEEVVVKPCITYTAKDTRQLLSSINRAYEQGYQLISTVYFPKDTESKMEGHLEAILCKPMLTQ